MNAVFDAFWRAVAYCLHPRVIVLSLLPLALMLAVSLGLGWLYWQDAVDAVSRWLAGSAWMGTVVGWLETMGLHQVVRVVAPFLVLVATLPLVVLGSLVLVAALMAPPLVNLVAGRRFADLERRRGGSLLLSIAWSLGSTALALVALLVSMPLWLVPPLILILPPLIWGWLTYRVMAFDALADHASKEERRELFRRHRMQLLAMGVLTGYLGAAPSVVWASGVLFAAAFLVLVPVAIWIYTLVFAFAMLWFTHYGLAALQALRQETRPSPTPPPHDMPDPSEAFAHHAPPAP